ncbi:hypothetical protein ZIOFF_050229 [Zingiber officinale]|uniref:Uncharacterized protein n=1 Tax=Zingiber officinale TaxID=94328 RepID=A0A8J5KLU5_ZINOF|nr:hypothetical protein ZIOFF_050229 [Zingiber officinale]
MSLVQTSKCECQITGTQGFLFLTIIYFDAVGCVLDVIMRLVMGVFLVAWMLIGIQNVFVAIPVNNQYLITRQVSMIMVFV